MTGNGTSSPQGCKRLLFFKKNTRFGFGRRDKETMRRVNLSTRLQKNVCTVNNAVGLNKGVNKVEIRKHFKECRIM